MRRMLFVMLAIALLTACDQKGSEPVGGQGGGAPMGGSALSSSKEIEMAEAVLKRDPQNVNAHIKLGNIYMDAQRYQDAIKHYQSALALKPDNNDVRVDMGTCFRYIGRPDLAIEHYKIARDKDPRHVNARMNLGIVLLYDLNRPDEAVVEFEKFLSLAPGSSNAAPIRAEVERIREFQKAQKQQKK